MGVGGIKQHILGQISLIKVYFLNRVVHINKGLEFHQCLVSTTKYIKPSVFLHLFRTKISKLKFASKVLQLQGTYYHAEI